MANAIPTLTRPAGMPALKPADFQRLQHIAYDRFGFDLRDGKEDMVAARLSNRVRELGFDTFARYLDHVMSSAGSNDFTDMVDLLTTNFTSFFREAAHFDFLNKYFARPANRNSQIRLWSAACSSGEEPYSLAISVLESPERVNATILATDISTRVLQKARNGVYPLDRLANISPDQQRKYFLRGSGKSEGYCRVKPALSSMIDFQPFNLVQPHALNCQFSMIWCRNVMIYFDKPTQERVVQHLTTCLEPGGYLLIGHSEALNGIKHQLQYVQPAVYQR